MCPQRSRFDVIHVIMEHNEEPEDLMEEEADVPPPPPPAPAENNLDWQKDKTIQEIMEYSCDNDVMLKDVTFLIGENKTPFHAHRWLLSLVSSRLFFYLYQDPSIVNRNPTHERRMTIEIVGIKPNTFHLLLRFIYCRRNEAETYEDLLDLLALGKDLEMSDLVNQCCEKLKPLLDTENALDILSEAIAYELTEIRDLAINHIGLNARAIIGTDRFFRLNLQTLSAIIGSDNLIVADCATENELIIFENVIRWAENRILSRNRTIDVKMIDPRVIRNELGPETSNILHLVRFPLMKFPVFGEKCAIAKEKIFSSTELISLFSYLCAPPEVLKQELDTTPFNKAARSRSTSQPEQNNEVQPTNSNSEENGEPSQNSPLPQRSHQNSGKEPPRKRIKTEIEEDMGSDISVHPEQRSDDSDNCVENSQGVIAEAVVSPVPVPPPSPISEEIEREVVTPVLPEVLVTPPTPIVASFETLSETPKEPEATPPQSNETERAESPYTPQDESVETPIFESTRLTAELDDSQQSTLSTEVVSDQEEPIAGPSTRSSNYTFTPANKAKRGRGRPKRTSIPPSAPSPTLNKIRKQPPTRAGRRSAPPTRRFSSSTDCNTDTEVEEDEEPRRASASPQSGISMSTADEPLFDEQQQTYIFENMEGESVNNLENLYKLQELAYDDYSSQQINPIIRRTSEPIVITQFKIPRFLINSNLEEFRVSYLYPSQSVEKFKEYLAKLELHNSLLFVKKSADDNLSSLWINDFNVSIEVNGLSILKLDHGENTAVISRIKEASQILQGMTFEEVENLHLDEVTIESLAQIPKTIQNLTLNKVRISKIKKGARNAFLKECKDLRVFCWDNFGQEILDFGNNFELFKPNVPKIQKISIGHANLECSNFEDLVKRPRLLCDSKVEELYITKCNLSVDFITALPYLFPNLRQMKTVEGTNLRVVLIALQIKSLEWIGVSPLDFRKKPHKGKLPLDYLEDKDKMKKILTDAGLGSDKDWLEDQSKEFILSKKGPKGEPHPSNGWFGTRVDSAATWKKLEFEHSSLNNVYSDEHLYIKMTN